MTHLRSGFLPPIICFLGLAALETLALTTGCSAEYYRREADRDTYRILSDKQQQVRGESYPFNVEPQRTLRAELERRNFESHLPDEALGQVIPETPETPAVVMAEPHLSPQAQMSVLFARADDVEPVGVPVDPSQSVATQPEAANWMSGEVEIPAIRSGGDLFVEPGQWPAGVRAVDLVDALQLAAGNSRSFQDRKEALYLVALELTRQQYAFENQYFGTVDASLAQTAHNVREGSILSALGFSRSFKTGGSMAVSITNTLFEIFTDPTGKRAESAISLAISQPILRGAGWRVAAEPLIQADRNVLYSVRDFERFKRSLAVSIATEFYRVLQQADQVTNERNNYANLILARQRTQELAKAGRLPEYQVDQARQDELRARNRWVTAVARYNQLVDDFRRTLGLPTEWPIVPDPASLTRLAAGGVELEIPPQELAVKTALANRLDVKTAEDQVADAARKVYVAADALRAGLDLAASADVPSNPKENKPADLRFEHGQYSVGALLDLPLDRLNERNVYRAAILDLQQAQRELTNVIDQVTSEVREDIRTLIRASNTYQIQANALDLARRRVDSTSMLLQAGRANTRDLLEARAALVEAQNALTAAIVDYHISRLELLRDMETLHVEPAGLTYNDPTTDKLGAPKAN